jgi:hypothetical protein
LVSRARVLVSSAKIAFLTEVSHVAVPHYSGAVVMPRAIRVGAIGALLSTSLRRHKTEIAIDQQLKSYHLRPRSIPHCLMTHILPNLLSRSSELFPSASWLLRQQPCGLSSASLLPVSFRPVPKGNANYKAEAEERLQFHSSQATALLSHQPGMTWKPPIQTTS